MNEIRNDNTSSKTTRLKPFQLSQSSKHKTYETQETKENKYGI